MVARKSCDSNNWIPDKVMVIISKLSESVSILEDADYNGDVGHEA